MKCILYHVRLHLCIDMQEKIYTKNIQLDHIWYKLVLGGGGSCMFVCFSVKVDYLFQTLYWVPIHSLKTLYEMIMTLGKSLSL